MGVKIIIQTLGKRQNPIFHLSPIKTFLPFSISAYEHVKKYADPSNDDIRLTSRLKDAGELIGIEVLDHIVFGDDNYKSMKDMGLL